MIRAPSARTAARGAPEALADVSAGRLRVVADRARLATIVAQHAGLIGSDAIAARPNALADLAQVRSDGEAALDSPENRAAYSERIVPGLADAADRINRHAARQAAVARAGLALSEIGAAQKAAAQSWQDPDRFVQGLHALAAAAASHADPEAPEADRAKFVRGAIGTAVGAALDHALDANEPEFASHILAGWGDSLPPAVAQRTVARLDAAAREARFARVFCDAAGGGDSSDDAARSGLVLDVPVAAAVHPLAGGVVSAVHGPADNSAITVRHSDGSSATYGGIGLAAVAPGDRVGTPQVLGSARKQLTLEITDANGTPVDPGSWLDRAGGAAAMTGPATAPRSWAVDAMLDRVAQHSDLSGADLAAAQAFAQRRMDGDHAALARGDRALAREVIAMRAPAPGRMQDAADIPDAITALASPAGLARIDNALRTAAQAPAEPLPGGPAALRIAILQRQLPATFANSDLAPLIAAVHPTELAAIAHDQQAILAGKVPESAGDARSAVLDALARHEWMSGSALPDADLPGILGDALARLRLDHTDPGDARAVEAHVADAIQSGPRLA